MSRPGEEAEAGDHPLAGVLDRLLSRERGARSPAPAVSPLPVDPRAEQGARRMLVVAGAGPDAGRHALAAIARWGLSAGRRIAIVDFDPAPPSATTDREAAAATEARTAIPLASIPCGLGALRGEDPATVTAVVERLRRHEAACDLLLVRIPFCERQALTKAAFLARGLVVPLDGGDCAVHAAFRLSRDLAESLPGISLVPFASDGAALDLYSTMVRDFLGVPAELIDTGATGSNEVLDSLAAPPAEGFLAALLADDAHGAPPCPRLLELGTLEV